MKILRLLSLAFAMTGSTMLHAAAPAGYYTSCEGKSGAALLSSLCGVVGPHTTVSYSGLWDLYQTTDLRSDGKIWDMYSTAVFTFKTDQCGNFSAVGDCYNREHSFPKSWFNDASPMVSDAFHIYPTDGKVNGQRSNYPYGECAGGTTLSAPAGIKALGRLGKSTFPGYSGTVFEPDDEYKGDFARSYFYMAAAYNTQISGWKSDMLANNAYPAFTSWAIDLLLKWHRQDPVSQKEINRNDAVYARQKNRNPFIDHPELAEYIWGENKTQSWTPGGTTAKPVITSPLDGSTIDLGSTVLGVTRRVTINVKGANLTAPVTLGTGSTEFAVSPSTLTAADVMSEGGANVSVTYRASVNGLSRSTLNLTSGTLRTTVNLTGSVVSGLPVGPVTQIGEDSFVATWSNVGDASADGKYTLDVRLEGASIDGYPITVTAADEKFFVEDLRPETTYTYVVRSEHITSQAVSVTTLRRQPVAEILYDGLLNLASTPGVPSEAAELLLLLENISDDVTLSVTSPFQLSSDKSSWDRTLTLSPEEDRFYLRLFSDRPGTFTTSITVTVGEYVNDRAEAQGVVSAEAGTIEDFEVVNSKMASYTPPQYQGTAFLWNFSDAGIWAITSEAHTGNQGVRLGKSATSSIEMADECPSGIDMVTFWAKRYGNDGAATVALEYTTDGGDTWKEAGSANITANTYSQFTFHISTALPARVRLRQTSGARVNIDDLEVTPYNSLSETMAADYHRWDAFCRDGSIIVEAREKVEATVYALDGTIVFAGTVRGQLTLTATPGLYVVSVGDFARRVVVR